MNLRDFEYLVAVDEERHFHRAAERCFVSQPTLSGQLKKLEGELGVLLVERNNRQVLMTEVGTLVARQARKVLAEVAVMRDLARSFDNPLAGELHVGLIPTLAPYLLPLIMPAMRQQFPDLKVWLHEYHTAVLLEKLRQVQLDVLILALPVDAAEFTQTDLFVEPFQLAVPKSADLARQTLISLGDLQAREMLLLEEGHCLRGQALDLCYRAGATEHMSFHASSLEILRHMVAEGMGITLMPQLAVPAHATRQDPVRYLPFQDPVPSRRIGMVYRRQHNRESAFSAIGDLIRKLWRGYHGDEK